MAYDSLHLTHKWRPNQFDRVVGQELAVKMLKNSLYKGYYFPVYLFSGLHGCGKTTMARIFSAALNCHQLPYFQKEPKKIGVPCLTCESCVAMHDGRHPDFIEIDAASHTGVDHVRHLIETASLLPVMDNRKIYLIDEAHMLSRAAFNALLKVLEEPPKNTFFMLVTTDVEKVIDTIRSRCFQIFFNAPSEESLVAHLQAVCVAEQIAFDVPGLQTIAREVKGAVRDALNLLEQVRFASGTVTHEAVVTLLGNPSPLLLIDCCTLVLTGCSADLLVLLEQESVAKFSAVALWQGVTRVLQAIIRAKYGVFVHEFVAYHERITQIANQVSTARLMSVVAAWYLREELFFKSKIQHNFFEITLLSLSVIDGNEPPCSSSVPRVKINSDACNQPSALHNQPELPPALTVVRDEPRVVSHHNEWQERWHNVVNAAKEAHELLLHSLFEQGHVASYDEETKQLTIAFSVDLIFCKELLLNAHDTWMPYIARYYGDAVKNTDFIFTRAVHEESTSVQVQPTRSLVDDRKQIKEKKYAQPSVRVSSSEHRNNNNALDGARVQEGVAALGEQAQLLMRYFPGTIEEIP